MSDALIDLAVRPREQTGLATTAEDRDRLARKISLLSQGEATTERAAVKRLFGRATKMPMPNRNRH